MRRTFAPLFLATALGGGIACLDQDSRLDDAIRQYVDQREAEVQAVCECYQLFINPDDIVDHDMFTSEQECLATFEQPPEEDVVNCIKSVLDSSGMRTEDSVDIMKCYTGVIAESTDCHAQNAGECAGSACSSGVAPVDECMGGLTVAEANALYYCVDL